MNLNSELKINMKKLSLPTTTLVCVDCRSIPNGNTVITSIDKSIKAVERCKALCDFTEVKLLTSLPIEYEHKVEIQPLPTLVDYSIFMLKKLHEYISTPHMLVIQSDGWILNPSAWEPDWINFDYMGPLFNQFDYQGVGGFSFRSNKLMKAMSDYYPYWDGTASETERIQAIVANYEDGAIALAYREDLVSKGFKFPSLEQASRFAQGGNPNNHYYVPKPFGFHGSWRDIDQVTGIVGSVIKHDGFIPEIL